MQTKLRRRGLKPCTAPRARLQSAPTSNKLTLRRRGFQPRTAPRARLQSAPTGNKRSAPTSNKLTLRRRGFQPRTAPRARLQSAPTSNKRRAFTGKRRAFTGKRFFRRSNSIFMMSLLDYLRAWSGNVRGGQAPTLQAGELACDPHRFQTHAGDRPRATGKNRSHCTYRPGSSPAIRTVSKLTVSTRPTKSTI